MERITITNEQEYNECRKYGFEPLVDIKRFYITPKLKREMVIKLFGEGNSEIQNEKFYHYVWDHKPHYCENCLKPLREYNAIYISHILSRGSHPELAYYPNNTNILCFNCHNKWEHATTRTSMRIYRSNQIVIANLLEERKQLKTKNNE